MNSRHPGPSSDATSAELVVRELVRTWGLFHAAMRPYFAAFGIGGAQWGVLRTLHRAEQAGSPALRLTDIGRRLLVQPPSVSTLVDRLQRMGLVLRRPAASDQRAREIVLTPAGRRLVTKVLRSHPRQMRKVIDGLSAAELRQLRTLMARFADHLETRVHGSPPGATHDD